MLSLCLLVSTVFDTVSSLHPTSTCFANFLSGLSLNCSTQRDAGICPLHVQVQNFISLSLQDGVQHIMLLLSYV